MRSSASGRMERGGFFPLAAPLSTSARTSNSWSRVSSMWRRQALEARVCCARVWRCGARASAARKKHFSGERECFFFPRLHFFLSALLHHAAPRHRRGRRPAFHPGCDAGPGGRLPQRAPVPGRPGQGKMKGGSGRWAWAHQRASRFFFFLLLDRGNGGEHWTPPRLRPALASVCCPRTG